MTSNWTRRAFGVATVALIAIAGCAGPGAKAPAGDPLPSWRDGPAKAAITDFVADVSREGSKSFVPKEERIAVFDNDGTLWAEQPLYFQFVFMLERVKAAAPRHPEWNDNPAYKALAAGDHAAAFANQKALFEVLLAADAGASVDEYDQLIRAWLAQARHPKTQRLYTEMVYQPQLELLNFLRSRGFKTFIVSGGSHEFMRPWSEAVYGIPPEQVVGSFTPLKFEPAGGQLKLVRQPGMEMNDGPTKPVGIYRQIGRRPILAVGNSDGDLQMLQFTTQGPGRRLAVIVHHDDAEREFAYDRKSHIGTLDKAWDEAVAKGWTLVSMKNDWTQIYPPVK
ncbi:HAD family hydrolase [Piscinibacter gummiphilus]|uniref:HAD family hydrolase n=1 Tax=Piscinibacter gummiphilus TaxID=946333 RepID=A0A1W6LGX3_9BURK|nr:HAD family hydrolase [Piscinibacter gummiphilus]ARN23505.1 HAD family hydrolase [Piscinibacter gummiphilus]ATU68213.1 haloacid dehalogenase-like hydrolase [Piscinibacter gummiphilus]GLS97535.1 haloacid dehalogenase [Piscinibacter gummiphilus]